MRLTRGGRSPIEIGWFSRLEIGWFSRRPRRVQPLFGGA
jgi:hypothetical protein